VEGQLAVEIVEMGETEGHQMVVHHHLSLVVVIHYLEVVKQLLHLLVVLLG
jgi:hypothetical protein